MGFASGGPEVRLFVLIYASGRGRRINCSINSRMFRGINETLRELFGYVESYIFLFAKINGGDW